VFIQRSKLIDGLFRAGLAAGQQVGNGAVALWVLWVKSRTETVKAVPVDVALGSFRVDVLTVGKVETAVIVLGVIGAVCSGSSVVSC